MRYFVGHDACDLCLVVSGCDQSAIDTDEAARNRKRIDTRVLNHEKCEVLRIYVVTRGKQVFARALNKFIEFDVVYQLEVLANLAHETATKCFFLAW